MKMKRLIALLLIMTMALVMCACDVSKGLADLLRTESDGIVGSWETEVELAELINHVLQDNIGMLPGINSLSCRLTIDFASDGTYTVNVNEEHLEEQLEQFMDSMWDVLVLAVSNKLGMSVDTVKIFLEKQNINKDNLLEKIDVEDMFSVTGDDEGYWKLEGNNLYMSNTRVNLGKKKSFTVNIRNNTLEITGGDLADFEYAQYIFPIVLTRK